MSSMDWSKCGLLASVAVLSLIVLNWLFVWQRAGHGGGKGADSRRLAQERHDWSTLLVEKELPHAITERYSG